MIVIDKKFYISDLHLFHGNCLNFDNRPFLNTIEQNKKIIENWNTIVGDGDIVYILGDVALDKSDDVVEILKQLKGHLHLIVGNHDKKLLKNPRFVECFETIQNYAEIKDKERNVVLCHYPIPTFNRHYYGAYHLYGHVHTGFEWNMIEYMKKEMVELYDTPCNMYNVGCMLPYMNYTPKTLDEIINSNIK